MILHLKNMKTSLDYITKYVFNNRKNNITNAVKISKNL